MSDAKRCVQIKEINDLFLFKIYFHDNILHFEITERGKPIFTQYFEVSLPHTSQIFVKIDGGKKRN